VLAGCEDDAPLIGRDRREAISHLNALLLAHLKSAIFSVGGEFE
jgi:hypothetical protein